jgi:hypothetical protein
VRLEPSKTYLVAVVESGGNIAPKMLVVVSCDAASCSKDVIGPLVLIDLSRELVSVATNDVYQIVLEEPVGHWSWSPYTLVLYEMGRNGPYDASAKYREWCDKHLYPELQSQLDDAQHPEEVDAPRTAYLTAGARYAMDDYRERAQGVKDAALEHALDWASSPYPDVQLFAEHAVEYAENSKLADKVLDALEKSSSELVRSRAFEIRKDRAQRREQEKGK